MGMSGGVIGVLCWHVAPGVCVGASVVGIDGYVFHPSYWRPGAGVGRSYVLIRVGKFE